MLLCNRERHSQHCSGTTGAQRRAQAFALYQLCHTRTHLQCRRSFCCRHPRRAAWQTSHGRDRTNSSGVCQAGLKSRAEDERKAHLLVAVGQGLQDPHAVRKLPQLQRRPHLAQRLHRLRGTADEVTRML